MDKIKFLPLLLLALFGIKGLILGLSTVDMCNLAALGLIAFLFELNLERKKIKELENKIQEQKNAQEKSDKDIESLKAFVTSYKMNNMRSVNGTFK